MMNTLKLPKSQLVPLYEWLVAAPLVGRDSRERTKFAAMLGEAIKELDADRLAIVDKYAELDPETGEKKKTVDNGREHFVVAEDMKEDFDKEIADLYKEEYVVDVMEGNKQKIRTIRDILLNTSHVFGVREGEPPFMAQARIREAANYDIWCSAFEAVDFSEA